MGLDGFGGFWEFFGELDGCLSGCGWGTKLKCVFN